MIRVTTHRLPLWLTLSLLAVILVLPSCVTAQDQWHWELTPDPSQLATEKEEVPIMWDGKEVGRCVWTGTANAFVYKVHIDHTNGTKTDVQASWTVTGLPPTQLVPGQKVRLVGTGTASGNPESFDKGPSAESSCSQAGLLNAPRGDGGTVGFVEGKFVTSKQWVVEGTVPNAREADRLEFFVQAGGAYATKGSLLKYVYKKALGPAEPTVTKPEPAPRPAPSLRLMLVTPKLRPNEAVAALVLISTGLKANEKMSGNLQLTVYRDTTGDDVAALMVSQKMGVPVSAGVARDEGVALCNDVKLIELSGPATSVFSSPRFHLPAPAREGEYRLEATLLTDDDRRANASVPFDVIANARRLRAGGIQAASVPAGTPCSISLRFGVEGTGTPGAPKPRAMLSGFVQAGEATAGAGIPQSLSEYEAPLTPDGNNAAEGEAKWQVVFPNPGLYHVFCQVYVPYYGTIDREATITVTGTGATVGGASNLLATALGERPPVGQAAAGGAAVTGEAPATTAETTATTGVATITATAGGGGQQATTTAGPTVLPSAGMVLTIRNGLVMITAVQEGSWAEQAGVRPGYQLAEIDDKPTKGLTLAQIKQRLTPQAGKELLILTLLDGYGNQLHVPLMTLRK